MTTTNATPVTPELKRFLDLVRGGGPSEFAGHMAARELADAALENGQFLDEAALRGFVVFLSVSHVDPDRANALLEDV